jgi:hypothetical protein
VTFTLTKDIELTQEWVSIGSNSASYFAGTFDGNGHTISNMVIDNTAGNCGFFGYLVGEVKNLNVEGAITSQDGNCGGKQEHQRILQRSRRCDTEKKITQNTAAECGCTAEHDRTEQVCTDGCRGKDTGHSGCTDRNEVCDLK